MTRTPSCSIYDWFLVERPFNRCLQVFNWVYSTEYFERFTRFHPVKRQKVFFADAQKKWTFRIWRIVRLAKQWRTIICGSIYSEIL